MGERGHAVFGQLTVELTDTAARKDSHDQFLLFRSTTHKYWQTGKMPQVRQVEVYWNEAGGDRENLVTVTLTISADSREEIDQIGEAFIEQVAERAGIRIVEPLEEESIDLADRLVLEASGRKLVNA